MLLLLLLLFKCVGQAKAHAAIANTLKSHMPFEWYIEREKKMVHINVNVDVDARTRHRYRNTRTSQKDIQRHTHTHEMYRYI